MPGDPGVTMARCQDRVRNRRSYLRLLQDGDDLFNRISLPLLGDLLLEIFAEKLPLILGHFCNATSIRRSGGYWVLPAGPASNMQYIHSCMVKDGASPVKELLIQSMFDAIDAQDHAALGQFFTADVVYERPGFSNICGFDDLVDFYRNHRIIKSGVHKVEKIIDAGESAVAIGQFVGALKDGRPANERFADAYTFRDGQICKRTTYFFRAAT